MIKVEVIEEFTLDRFDEIKATLVRKNEERNEEKHLYVDDTFECKRDLADYLMGENRFKRAFVKIIEVVPDEVKKDDGEQKEKKAKTKTKKSVAKK